MRAAIFKPLLQGQITLCLQQTINKTKYLIEVHFSVASTRRITPEPTLVVPAPVVPGGAAPVVLTAPALVAIDDGEPVGAAIGLDDEDEPIVTAVTDDTVPLTNRELDEHKCCILSFLLMLAALIIYTCFTHSMKKRQKKLAELKDQLEEEKLKRQLGMHFWELPALIILIVVIVAFAWKHHDMKKQERDLEDQISELYADDAVPMDGSQA